MGIIPLGLPGFHGCGYAAVDEGQIIIPVDRIRETFEERSILAKYKEGDNFNRRNTLSISRIEI